MRVASEFECFGVGLLPILGDFDVWEKLVKQEQ